MEGCGITRAVKQALEGDDCADEDYEGEARGVGSAGA